MEFHSKWWEPWVEDIIPRLSKGNEFRERITVKSDKKLHSPGIGLKTKTKNIGWTVHFMPTLKYNFKRQNYPSIATFLRILIYSELAEFVW